MNNNERICLVIDGCILIARHTNGYTFVGGTVSEQHILIGETCMRELEEELGIRISTKIPKIISYVRNNNKLHILFVLNVGKNDIEFISASHVWEIREFTLIPINKNINPEPIANWLIDNIKKTNPCSTHVKITNNSVSVTNSLPQMDNNKDTIFIDGDTYYIKLTPQPKLSINEKQLLRHINLQINGIADELFIYNNNQLCNLKYNPYKPFMFLQMSTKLITQIEGIEYSTNATYSDIINNDFKKFIANSGRLPLDIEVTLKSIVSTTKQQLSKYGLKDLNNVSFYYLDKEVYCCQNEQRLMFDDIDDYDFIKPIEKLSKYYNGSVPNYYDVILHKYTKLSEPLYIYDFDYELDEILLQYTKCVNNISVMITWAVCNINDITKSDFYNELSKHGNIHAIKEIIVTQKQLYGIIYQVYYNKSGFKNYDAIKGKANKCGYKDDNRLFIIFYKARKPHTITGTDAPLKISLRKLLKKNSNNTEELKDNMYLHISDTHSEAVELAQLFCNKNSMRLLQYQRLDRLLRNDFWKSLIYFMTTKSWIASMTHPIDQIRFLLFSSIVLYTLGLRNINDIDMIIHYLPTTENTKTEHFFDKINMYFENKNTKFPFVVDGASIKGRNGWFHGGQKEYLIDWFEHDWPAMFGAVSMDDIILNPRFHYYYFGLKIVSLEGDMKRRIQRSRPASYADLFALKKFVNDKFDIPHIPDGYWKNHIYYKFTDKELNELVKKIVYYLKIRYSIKVEKSEIQKKLNIVIH